jgi:hypothetical protein
MYIDYMWVDISNWEFGRMHDELRTLGSQGWEVDGVVDEQLLAPVADGGNAAAVSLRLRRQRSY